MKNHLKVIFSIFAVSSVLILSGNASAQVNVGFVDSEVIIKQLPEAQQVQKQLEDLQKLYVDTITTKENELKEKAETFQTKYQQAQTDIQNGTITSQDQIDAIQSELEAMQTEIRTLDEGLTIYKQKVQNDLIQKQGELFQPVKEKITKTIEDVAKEMKISFVFDKADGTMLYGDKKYDITFKVLDKLK
ncbi:MAG: OmpH family outer membrane protein [Ignavibacteriae bacterium]|nr:OmpH family outer membrane protein [Ignavibacteriota bacterium]